MALDAKSSLLAGRYRIGERLGSGGMASVHLAEDTRLGRHVALKRLRAGSGEDLVRRFNREARVGASLNHPNIVAVYDVLVEEEDAIIVMEYVEGENLDETLARGPLSVDRSLEILHGLAGALDHAHSHGVVHRDVKPGNVILGSAGRVKLADLGIATATDMTRVTTTGTVLGSPSYMAPEQLEGREAGPPADVYALAALAFEMLGGRRARPGATPIEVAHRVVNEPPPDLREAWPDAPAAAAAALRRGLSPDPADRPESAGAFVSELHAALADPADAGATTAILGPAPVAEARPPAAPRPRPAPAPRPARPAPARRLPWLVAVAGLGLVVLAIALATGGDEQGADRSAGRDQGKDTRAAPDEPAVPPPAQGAGDPARGTALNDRGKALIDQGSPEAAVPVLEKAVSSFPRGTDDINYAFALFNLGNALRLAGRPEEAIPILERRLEIPNQPETVQAELEAAREAAARTDTTETGGE